MKKICFVAEYMYCGGTEKSLLSLLNCLDRSKYQVTILLLDKKGPLLSDIPEDVIVKTIPLPPDEKDDLLLGRGAAIKNSIKKGHYLRAVQKAIRGCAMSIKTKGGTDKRRWYYESIEDKLEEYPEEFDVAVDYFGYGLFNTLYTARKVKAKYKISWVHFEPDHAIPDFDVFEAILNEYDNIMCVSSEGKRQMQHMMPSLKSKLHVFHNIVDAKSIIDQASQLQIEKELGTIHILTVGRLDPQKGLDIALKSIEMVAKDGYSIRWHIVGQGPQRAELERMIQESETLQKCVILHGQQLNPYAYIDMCDIYFQPSRHEGYGIAVAEARAFCKPIVVTDFAGAREQLRDRETGLITQCTVEGLYRALVEMISDQDLREKLTHNLSLEREANIRPAAKLEEIFDSVN